MALSRPVDTDTTQPMFPPMEPGIYKWQVKKMVEWGSNKDLNIKGDMSKMSQADQDNVDVISLRWSLQVVEDPRYDGTSGGKPKVKDWFTTYWASQEKIEASYLKSTNKYLEDNPTATEDDVAQYVRRWKPQINTFEFLHACHLMERVEDEDNHTVEYIPVGWELTPDGLAEAVTAALGCIVYGTAASSNFGHGCTFLSR